MSERLTDDQVAWYAGTSRTAKWTADMAVHENIVTLAREVQEYRALRPICPTCGGKQWWRHVAQSAEGIEGDYVDPCPDCTDGRMPLDKWVALLVQTLTDAREDVEGWAAYAEPYFIQKHDLAGDLAAIDAVLKMAGVI